ncbi:MAG: SDR family oxidoreductase [Flavobacteriaceae bacterium]
MSFLNKVVWITGASSGIGRALAIHLANQNVKLILSSRQKETLEEVQQQCRNPKGVYLLPLDLAKHSSFKEKTTEAIAAFGKVDILVNNGGISQRSLAKDTALEVDKRILDINYLGTVALSKEILPHFIKNQSGQFAVTTSIVGKIGTPLRSSYAASKHALHGFFDSLRAEHHKDNISVTLICPGFVATNISINALTGDGSSQKKMDSATANGIQPERFAKLMARAIKHKKEEVYIAGAKEKLGVYVKRWFPKLFSIMVRKLSVT